MKPARITHEGIEFHCELSVAHSTAHPEWWFLDFVKYVINDGTNSKQMMGSGKTEAECLRCVPVGIKTLIEWGLPPDKACDLVADAIGGVKEVDPLPEGKGSYVYP